MKKKTKFIETNRVLQLALFTTVFAVLALMSGCDMDLLEGNFTNNEPLKPYSSSDDPARDPSVIPCLTIVNLPAGTQKNYFSNVFIYNGFGTVMARCAAYNQIVITDGSDYVTARIPLAYGNGEPFRESGNFSVSFSLYIDSKEDSYTISNSLFAAFTYGSGTFDFLKNASSSVELGFFSGGLDNPSDAAAPVIKSGTVFEMNGNCYTVTSKTAFVPSSFSNTCIVYVYVRLVFDQLEFFYSAAPPVYDYYKKGYYNGLERALYKSVFIRDSTNKYFAKTFINDNWSHLNCQTVVSSVPASQNLPQHYYLSGADNPQMQTVTFPAGAYLFTLNGAAGGSTPSYNGTGGEGGAGGHISEVVTLSQNTSFTFFTGESGKIGSADSYTSNNNTIGAMGGSGGGSGSFAFSPDGYFLCAGGGGGSTGVTASYGQSSTNPSFNPVTGGAGGSIGGGSSGNLATLSSVSGSGGIGGGLYGGITPLTAYSYSRGFNGNGGNAAAYFNLPPPNNWLNTNNANGRGADASANAQSGGNNRNSARGGGGGNGSITVFKIN